MRKHRPLPGARGVCWHDVPLQTVRLHWILCRRVRGETPASIWRGRTWSTEVGLGLPLGQDRRTRSSPLFCTAVPDTDPLRGGSADEWRLPLRQTSNFTILLIPFSYLRTRSRASRSWSVRESVDLGIPVLSESSVWFISP